MRRYELSLLNAQGQLLANTSAGFSVSSTSSGTFSSTVKQQNGQFINNPGALNIELDIISVGFALPQGSSWVRVSGIGLKTIAQGANLNANPATGQGLSEFILKAGMLKGLPLANPAQFGIIAQGQIITAFGNWQGPEQSLDLNLLPADLTPSAGVVFIWSPGQELGDAIKNTLTLALPDLQAPSVTVMSGLLQSQSILPVVGWYESLSQFASYILPLSKALGQPLRNNYYPGIIICIKGDLPYATDATQNPRTVQLAFQDLIGQPTWIGPNTISFKCVLRYDIQVGDMVTMPPDPGTGGTSIISALALTQQGVAVPGQPTRNSSVFKGSFMVNEVHHFGNLRQPDADSWATAFTAVNTGPTQAGTQIS